VRGFDPEKLTNDIRGRSEGRRVRGVWHGAAIDADLVMYSGTARSPRRPSPGAAGHLLRPSVRSFFGRSIIGSRSRKKPRARAGLLYMAVGPAVGSLRADGDRGGGGGRSIAAGPGGRLPRPAGTHPPPPPPPRARRAARIPSRRSTSFPVAPLASGGAGPSYIAADSDELLIHRGAARRPA